MADQEKKEPGFIKQIFMTFKDKLKELNARESAVAFIIVAIVFLFGVTGFVSAIGAVVVKIVQVIGTVATAGFIPAP